MLSEQAVPASRAWFVFAPLTIVSCDEGHRLVSISAGD
ncbi:MAG: hypothetical protein OJF51_001696 [Nitrospira sp.]|nr:MAG: hypothetical protein OJF51_001696 [Nitrospira sp.]